MWLIPITLLNVLGAPLGPSCFTLGLEPLGELAGTASAVMGFITTALGAALAALINARIGLSVTPMAVGYVAYGAVALAALMLAEPSGSVRSS